jgi:hypothetical protein
MAGKYRAFAEVFVVVDLSWVIDGLWIAVAFEAGVEEPEELAVGEMAASFGLVIGPRAEAVGQDGVRGGGVMITVKVITGWQGGVDKVVAEFRFKPGKSFGG